MLKIPSEKLNNGGHIRNVFDVGCGLATFGLYLLPLDIIAMSLAPNDVHKIKFSLHLRDGIPSALGVLFILFPYKILLYNLKKQRCTRKKGSGLEPWPLRLTTASHRLEEIRKGLSYLASAIGSPVFAQISLRLNLILFLWLKCVFLIR